MKLTPTETVTLKRKSLATILLSCDLKPEALRRDLVNFNQEVIRTISTKRLKDAELVLVETEGDE